MIEKLEHCPTCGALLAQADYDFQRHLDHWHTILPPDPLDYEHDPYGNLLSGVKRS